MTKTKPNAFSFIETLVKTWGALMSGLFSILLTVIGFSRRAQPYNELFFLLSGVVCILITTYLLWAKERNDCIGLQEYLAKADLKIELQGAWRSTDIMGQYFLLQLAIANHSIATAAVARFDVRVLGDAGWVKDIAWTEVNKQSLFASQIHDTNQRANVNRETKDLSVVLARTPLARGERQQGYIEFYFQKLREYGGTIKVQLTLTDALGDTHTAEADVPYSVDTWVD